jgi:glycosyltransferase involved in cell wall biosynthesis
MTARQIRVSIGVPVYNGENYLEAALDSLLAQTFEEFEIIISDNASTDRTSAISRAYAAKDDRVRYLCNPINIGASQNFNRVVKLARADYFKWAAHDDLCHPEFLAKCVAVLDQHPEVINCYARTQIVDEQGHLKPETHEFDGQLRLDADQPNQRFHDIVCTFQMCYSLFGVIRKAALMQTPLYGSYSHADGVLLARLVLLGKFYELPEYLFFSRQHAQQSWQMFDTGRDHDRYRYTAWFDPVKAGKILLPYWRIFGEYSRSILIAPISYAEKMACGKHMLKWLQCYWTHMARELPIAASQLVRSVLKWAQSLRPPAS